MLLRRYVQEKLGYARRKFFVLVQDGQVILNGTVVQDFSCPVTDGDELLIDGIQYIVSFGSVDKHLLAFHKPVGYVVSRDDEHNRSIYELLPAEFKNYRYIGRLDKDSRGLVLLSNDLDLVHRLSHPSSAGEKVYDVELDDELTAVQIQQALAGLRDGEDVLRAIDVIPLDQERRYRITLQEGKNRHIRRMFAVLGREVLDLCRISHGGYALGDLKEGEHVLLNSEW